MSIGWAFTFWSLLYVVLLVVPFYIMRNGQKWRDEMAEKKDREKLAKAEKEAKAVEADIEAQETDDDNRSVHEQESSHKEKT